MAFYSEIKQPTQQPHLINVNHTPQGGGHPVPSEIVKNIIDTAVTNEMQRYRRLTMPLRMRIQDERDFEEGRDGTAFGTQSEGFSLKIGSGSSLLERRKKMMRAKK